MDAKDLLALKEKRFALITQARALLDIAGVEKRSLTAEENNNYNLMIKDVDSISETIKAEEQLRDLERSVNNPRVETAPALRKGKDVVIDAARSFLQTGKVSQECYAEWRALQERALSQGNDTSGGYLVMPEQFAAQLIRFVDDILHIRQVATVISVNRATSLGAVSLDTDPDDADWTTEIATGSEDSSTAFGKRSLTPHPFAKRIKISNSLLNNATQSVESIVMERLAYKFRLTEEKGFLTGNGSQRPLGLFTASALGISTSRDVSTDNTTTSMTFDGLMNTKYSLKPQYRNSANCRWMFHRDAVKQIAKLKDGEGKYIWQPSVTLNTPDMLLNVGVMESENASNTFTTGLYVGLIGDFKFYWIADAMDLMIKRLDELYAETDQVGFIGRKSCDGMPVLEEAFARVKLA
jgi:HK97 family phage major capsid protein